MLLTFRLHVLRPSFRKLPPDSEPFRIAWKCLYAAAGAGLGFGVSDAVAVASVSVAHTGLHRGWLTSMKNIALYPELCRPHCEVEPAPP